MIDRLGEFSKKIAWLKPLFFASTGAGLLVFVYVIFIAQGNTRDVWIIPSMVAVLWSLVCSLLLSVFPCVPPKPDEQQRLPQRLKIRLIRGGYHIGSWIFCALTAALLLLTVRLLSVWSADF